MYRTIPEDLSNQRRSKKIGTEEETKETEPDVLQRQRNKGVKGLKSGRRGIMLGALLKLLLKDKLLHSGKVHVNAQLRPLRREKCGTEVQQYGTLKEAIKMGQNNLQFLHKTATHIFPHPFIHTSPFLAQ